MHAVTHPDPMKLVTMVYSPEIQDDRREGKGVGGGKVPSQHKQDEQDE